MRGLSWVVPAACVLGAACSLFPDVSGLSGIDAAKDSSIDAALPVESGADVVEAAADAIVETGSDASDAASCTCSGMVSAYLFTNPNSLGHDFLGNNDFTFVAGTPKQSTTVPAGFGGYSMQLDGASSVCITSGFTFDTTSDHSLCWWSQPTALANSTNQFAQTCGYDTWTQSSGVDYLWRINNCNNGTPENLVVPNVFSANNWVQICQTYKAASMTRTVVIGGDTSNAVTQVDTVPIVEDPTGAWCIGSYKGGGYWTGYIYEPMWFDRVLGDQEIKNAATCGCGLP